LIGLSYLPYLIALEQHDTSLVVPLFQITPIFGIILARFFLGEIMNIQQLGGAGILIISAVLLGINFK